MDRLPDVLEGRLEQIAYPHIRERLLQLRDDPQAMLDYVNHLFLDTRGGTRRGFDFTTAAALMDIKHDLMLKSGEFYKLREQAGLPDGEFKAAPDKPVTSYTPLKLPKGW
ncbi:hypothetical protein [Tepidimonas sp. HKU79]|uniref:hypothetical protein n=1 Tax=unclassified Tepidimonas TaxID=2631705 RepID=UPI002636897E|nr:hypothetical protein [uncultured Tepidimonas sp.]